MKKTAIAFLSFFLIASAFSQETDPEQKEKEGFFASTVDFLVNGPYSLNIGCEPTSNKGSKFFGSLEYRWTPDFSSQIYFEKGDDFTYDNDVRATRYNQSMATESKDYFLKVFPYKKYHSSDDGTAVFSLSLGLAFQYDNVGSTSNEILPNSIYGETPPVDDKYFAVYRADTRQQSLILGPCIDFEYTYPLTEWMSFRAEHSIVPFYFSKMKIEHSYEYINRYASPDQSVGDYVWNTGVLQLKYHLDFFKYVALVGNYELTRFPDYSMGYDSSYRLTAERCMKITNTLRFGAALLESTDTYVRIQTGFYREYGWTTSANNSTQFSKKWVLSVSVGF